MNYPGFYFFCAKDTCGPEGLSVFAETGRRCFQRQFGQSVFYNNLAVVSSGSSVAQIGILHSNEAQLYLILWQQRL